MARSRWYSRRASRSLSSFSAYSVPSSVKAALVGKSRPSASKFIGAGAAEAASATAAGSTSMALVSVMAQPTLVADKESRGLLKGASSAAMPG